MSRSSGTDSMMNFALFVSVCGAVVAVSAPPPGRGGREIVPPQRGAEAAA